MFYHYSQNNSGGSFDFDISSGITHHVVIEANSADEANTRAESIGLYFDGGGDCPCCGNRWSSAWSDKGSETPELYGAELGVKKPDSSFGNFGWMQDGYETAVHFKDGTVKWYFTDNTENTNPSKEKV